MYKIRELYGTAAGVRPPVAPWVYFGEDVSYLPIPALAAPSLSPSSPAAYAPERISLPYPWHGKTTEREIYIYTYIAFVRHCRDG